MSSSPAVKPLQHEPSSEALGAAWIGPALVVAGLLVLGRVELATRMMQANNGANAEWSRWSLLADWPALVVQALMMSAAAVAVIWSAKGARRALGILVGTLILASALSGWPVAAADQIYRDAGQGLPSVLQLASVCLGVSAAISALAAASHRNRSLTSVLAAKPLLFLVATVALGLPCWKLWGQSLHAPVMPIREVLAKLSTDGGWQVAFEQAHAPARTGTLSPFVAEGLQLEEYDTLDKTSVIMSPPCELSFTIPAHAEDSFLLVAAQISGQYTFRGLDVDDSKLPSELDERGLESLSVRFEVLIDGQSVFEETITHRDGDGARARAWRHVGENGKLTVEPGQRLTLRTQFGNESSARAFGDRPLNAGFADLVLERWSTQDRTHATPSAPNILFITVDTLRSDRMSSYGYGKSTTPHMDSLARRGLLFERAFSTSSWTSPSTASLFTGLLPYEHGVLSKASSSLRYSSETLAECLQAGGYTTAAVSASPLIARGHQFDQGFESFDGSRHLRNGEDVIDSIESKLRAISKARFYLYVHLADPHTPHNPLPEQLKRLGGKAPDDFPARWPGGVPLDGMDDYAQRIAHGDACDEFGVIRPETAVPREHMTWISDRYDASVGTADHYVGRILVLLRELELEESTVVVLTSDHGEELFDHGMLGHGHTIHRELVQVPLLIAGPGVPKGWRSRGEVSNRHLAVTLANLGGVDLGDVEDGVNLLTQGFVAPDVFYQTSEGYWNGHHPTEIQGLRGDGTVVHFAPSGGPWKQTPSPSGQARIYSTEPDFLERTDLSIDDRYAAQAQDKVQAISESVKAQVLQRNKRYLRNR